MQLDGSPHDWLEGRGAQLTALGMQDDATGKILAGQFFPSSELRLARAADMDSANAVLRKFIADYNRRFARNPREAQTARRPAPESLERICCFLHERIVSNDNVVQWQGQRFQIPQQARRFSFAGAKLQIYQALDDRVAFYYGDTRLEHQTIPGG